MLRAARFPVVVCAAKSSGDSLPHGPFPPPFRLTKPTWVVKTEFECVEREGREARAALCHLSWYRRGALPTMPGKRCSACGGSGLSYCSRCLGTGEYREAMGFHFMKMHENSARAQHENDHSQ